MSECFVVQDLLIPYLAGDVSAQTRDLVNAHLDICPACRGALDQLVQPAPALHSPGSAPSQEPERRLLRRLGRHIWLGIALLATFVLLTVGLAVSLLVVTRMPLSQPPAPPAALAAKQLAEIDLSVLGLRRVGVDERDGGALATYQDRYGHMLTIEFHKYENAGAAQATFTGWKHQFKTKTSAISTERSNWGSMKLKSGDTYYHAWYTDNWFIKITVPDEIPNAADLRNDLHEHLLRVFKYMS